MLKLRYPPKISSMPYDLHFIEFEFEVSQVIAHPALDKSGESGTRLCGCLLIMMPTETREYNLNTCK